MADRVGQQLGHYHLVRLLGRGGQAEVYLGEHRYLKSFAALKMLHASLDERLSEQFLAEAQTLARLSHPSIVRVLDFTVEQGTPVLIMDYSPEGTMRQRYPPTPLDRGLRCQPGRFRPAIRPYAPRDPPRCQAGKSAAGFIRTHSYLTIPEQVEFLIWCQSSLLEFFTRPLTVTDIRYSPSRFWSFLKERGENDDRSRNLAGLRMF